MVSTLLGVLAASWAMLMALSPLLQVREIRRRRSSLRCACAGEVV